MVKFNQKNDPQDPLGLDEEQKRIPTRKPRRTKRIVHLEDLQNGGQSAVDTNSVISLYLPQRRIRRFAAALLRLNRLYLLLLGLLLVLAILFILAFTQEKMGNFTINLNRLEMYRKGISISSDAMFHSPTSRLEADAVVNATNISILDLPESISENEGSHNGRNYMAYTFFIRNAGKETVDYTASIRMDSSTKGAEQAVRVAVWKNGVRTVYAVPGADGNPEKDCVSFLDDRTVCTFVEPEFLVGNVNRYTVAIWLEGDDPECVDNIVGGSVQFSMLIDSEDDDSTSLITKFFRDIVDMLTNDKPIYSSSDESVPSYYLENDINWENRRNQ